MVTRAPLINISTLPTPRPVVQTAGDTAVIAVVDQGATNADVPAQQPNMLLFNSAADVFESDGTTRRIGTEGTAVGTVTKFYAGITRDPLVLIPYDGSLTGAALTTAIENALDLVPRVNSTLGVHPEFIMTPERTWNGTRAAPETASNAVVTKMQAIASSVNAIGLVSGPPIAATGVTTVADVVTWGSNNYGSELIGIYPHATDGSTASDAAAYFAASLARLDSAFGFWEAPTGKRLYGITDTAPRLTYDPTSATAEAGVLANAGFIAGVSGDAGWQMWGNTMLLASSSTEEQHFNRQRIHNHVLRLLLAQVGPLVGRPVSIIRDTAVAVANDALEPLVGTAIFDLRVSLPPSVNTPANLQSGNITFDIEYAPSVSAERITFRLRVNPQTITID